MHSSKMFFIMWILTIAIMCAAFWIISFLNNLDMSMAWEALTGLPTATTVLLCQIPALGYLFHINDEKIVLNFQDYDNFLVPLIFGTFVGFMYFILS